MWLPALSAIDTLGVASVPHISPSSSHSPKEVTLRVKPARYTQSGSCIFWTSAQLTRILKSQTPLQITIYISAHAAFFPLFPVLLAYTYSLSISISLLTHLLPFSLQKNPPPSLSRKCRSIPPSHACSGSRVCFLLPRSCVWFWTSGRMWTEE